MESTTVPWSDLTVGVEDHTGSEPRTLDGPELRAALERIRDGGGTTRAGYALYLDTADGDAEGDGSWAPEIDWAGFAAALADDGRELGRAVVEALEAGTIHSILPDDASDTVVRAYLAQRGEAAAADMIASACGVVERSGK